MRWTDAPVRTATRQGLRLICLLGLGMLASGCHSAFVQATVINEDGKPVKLLEVDYPTASFGTGELASGASFRYRFKILGDGASKVSWTDAASKDHVVQGPTLKEGQEGTLTIVIKGDGARWEPALHAAR